MLKSAILQSHLDLNGSEPDLGWSMIFKIWPQTADIWLRLIKVYPFFWVHKDWETGLSKKTTYLRSRVAEINFGLMSTNIYDSGRSRSRKVKTPHK